MPRFSAGLLLYRRDGGRIEVFLIHHGGPFWADKDAGSWSIPKGEYGEGEDSLAAAQRELREETGCTVSGPFHPLTPIKQRGGKIVTAWAVEADCDAESIQSNTFRMAWPPHSGKFQSFPEVDRAGWFFMDAARVEILASQLPFLDELSEFPLALIPPAS